MTDRSGRVNEHDISFFQEQGYLRYEGFFSAAEMSELREAIDRAIAEKRERIRGAESGGRVSEEYERVFNQMVNLWTDLPAAKAFAFHPELADAGRRLSGCRHVRIYHDHAMVKPPGQTSRATNWHQDAPYWRMDPVGSFSAWIAVDDVDGDNGCLHFVPGSHRYGRQEPISLTVEGESIIDRMHARGFSCGRAGLHGDGRRRRHFPPRLHLPLRRAQSQRQSAASLRHHLHTGLRDVHRWQRRCRRGRRDDGRRPVGPSGLHPILAGDP